MKSRTLVALALSVSALLAGCDSSTSTGPNTPVNNASINLAGRLRLDNTGSGTIKVTTAGLESALTRNSDGSYSYSLVGTGKVVAARALSDTVVGYVYLVANDTDTLREIAIRSWSGTVPTNYVVQRNLSITVPAQYVSDTVEAVYWNQDSVAYVLRAPRSSGVKHSTYIYTAYDSAAYYNGKYLFTAFARIRDQHGVVAYTRAFDTAYADAGDLGAFDASDFVVSNDNILKSVPGYTVIVNGAEVSKYAYTSTVTDSTTTVLAETDSTLWHGWHGATVYTVSSKGVSDTNATDSVFNVRDSAGMVVVYTPDTAIRTRILYNNGLDSIRRSVPDSVVVDLYTDSALTGFMHPDLRGGSVANIYHSYDCDYYTLTTVVDSGASTTRGHRYHAHLSARIGSDTTSINLGSATTALGVGSANFTLAVTHVRYRTEQVVYTRTTKTTAARKH